MARDIYIETLTYVDLTTGALKPLSNAQVTVYVAGTTTKATLYAARDTNNNTQVANPFTTGTSGLVEFWIDAGEWDISVVDSTSPARVANKTFGFSALPAAAGGIPSSRIAADGGLAYNALDAVAKRQDVPIGGVIDWWRPANTVPVPTGFVICDGSVVTAANHEFPGIATDINVPDLRNVFILGANSSNADGTGATAGSDTAAGAPGIRGTGGSNVRNLEHTHDLGNHTHTIAHTHTMAHTHEFSHTHEHPHTHSYVHTHTMPHTHDLGNHTHSYSHTHGIPPHYHDRGTLTIDSSAGYHFHNAIVNDPGHRHHMEAYDQGGAPGQIVSVAGWNAIRADTTGGGSARGLRVFGDGAFMAAYGVGAGLTGISVSIGTDNSNHGHPNSAFSGHVGNTGGGNGDQTMTTSSQSTSTSGGPSTNTSGAASSSTTATQSNSTTSGTSGDTTSAPNTSTTGAASTSTTSASSAANSGTPSTNTSGAGGSASQDIRPKYVGLLRIMKVRRN